MAEACTIASLGQLAWVADWYIRNETYALALRHLVDHQQREPLAAIFGGGFASSSDGQFFRAGGFGRDAAPSTPITAMIPEANSTRTSPIAMPRSTRK